MPFVQIKSIHNGWRYAISMYQLMRCFDVHPSCGEKRDTRFHFAKSEKKIKFRCCPRYEKQLAHLPTIDVYWLFLSWKSSSRLGFSASLLPYCFPPWRCVRFAPVIPLSRYSRVQEALVQSMSRSLKVLNPPSTVTETPHEENKVLRSIHGEHVPGVPKPDPPCRMHRHFFLISGQLGCAE